MDPAAPLPLLEALAPQLPAEAIRAALARSSDALTALLEEARRAPSWGAEEALRQAHLWLVAGVPGRGDDLVLEADRLAPEAAVIPDWWGFWPRTTAEGEASTQGAGDACRALASSYLLLRHLPAMAAWRAWVQAVQPERQRLDDPALRLLLGLVIHGRAQLPGALEPALEQPVGEELVTAEPALCRRFFDAVSARIPTWGYGRLKAADLSLQRGELERCRIHLNGASEAQWDLAWLHDVAARLALAEGDVLKALTAWQRAIERCGAQDDGSSDQATMVELFRQRAREARRGPGVLQARSLLNRGDREEAVALLNTLLQQDPQWQPLRSLLEQARQGDAASSPGVRPVATAEGGNGDLQRLQGRLEELARRAALPWPPSAASAEEPGADAAAFEQFLQQALGRLALLG